MRSEDHHRREMLDEMADMESALGSGKIIGVFYASYADGC